MMAFFPNFMLRDLFVWLIVLNVLLFLAVFYPWELGLEADPFAPAPEGIKPEWYFMFMFQTLKWIPAHVLGLEGEMLGVMVFGVAGLAWMLVPFWEIRSQKHSSCICCCCWPPCWDRTCCWNLLQPKPLE